MAAICDNDIELSGSINHIFFLLAQDLSASQEVFCFVEFIASTLIVY